MTIPTINIPATPKSGAESTTLQQQEVLHEEMQGQFKVAEDEMRRQEEERARLTKKLEDWTREQEEEKRQREAAKRQQEAREAEDQRKADLSASTARLRAARDDQLRKLARNEEDLQHMREAAADIDRQSRSCARKPAETHRNNQSRRRIRAGSRRSRLHSCAPKKEIDAVKTDAR